MTNKQDFEELLLNKPIKDKNLNKFDKLMEEGILLLKK